MDKTSQITTPEEKLKYRISIKGLVIITLIVTLPLLPLWYVANQENWQNPVILWAFVILIFAFPYTWFILELEIDSEGIRLYRINITKWDEVVSARKMNVFGLKYLQVTRRKKMNCLIPFYFKGQRPIEDALKEKCPAGNPIHQLLALDSQS